MAPSFCMARDWVPNWSGLLTVLGVGFPIGMGFLREILENLYCLSKRGVAVHPKASRALTVGSGQQLWWSRCAQMDQLLPIVAGLRWNMLGLMRCGPRQLSEYRDEVDGLLPAQDVERWKHNILDFDDLTVEQKECSTEPPLKGEGQECIFVEEETKAPFYAFEDGDIEMLYPDLFHVQAAEEAVVEEDRAKDAVDEMVADVAEHAYRATKGVADQMDTEEASNQWSPAGVSD
ncbi:unnamed protein product [Prunus armeniaca]